MKFEGDSEHEPLNMFNRVLYIKLKTNINHKKWVNLTNNRKKIIN